jgi:ubiquinone/menaquinone biosynthesis C-methylase UbiE
MEELDYTGERIVTQINNVNTIEHLHRYAFVLDFVKNKNVLDIACGEGYGSNLLAKNAKHVFGVDIDEKTILHAKGKYRFDNLSFFVGSTSIIPLDSNSIDLAVSFETIEHHDQHDEMMKEILRVLKPDGLFIISSPEKSVNEDIALYKNEFHIKELYFKEFNELLIKYFKNILFYDQKMVFGSCIVPKEPIKSTFQEFKGDFLEIQSNPNLNKAKYNLAIASNSIIEYCHTSIFNGQNFLNQLMLEKENIYHSITYKTGQVILYPLKVFKKYFRISK